MSRIHAVLLSIGALVLLAIGFVAGRTLSGKGPLPLGTSATLPTSVDEHVHGDHDGHVHHEAVIELSSQASQNLGLMQGTVARTDYWRTLQVPAQVIEKPGHSSHGVAAPLHGIVRRVLAVPGQAVAPGDPLMELRVTDEQLAQAQLDLLQDITRLEVIATELERLAPLIAEGSVAGRQHRELQYEQQQLTAKRKLHIQALLLHGLNEQQVETILTNKELIRDVTVHLTADHQAMSHPEAIPAEGADRVAADYTVERLDALPGTAVRRGDDLCQLAYHAELYLQGQSFENELEQVSAAADRGWPITAEFGIEGELYERTGLAIQYIDNHVDSATQTFSFYVPIVNEVTRDVVNEEGVRFRTWRFKPGQRARLRIPIERWEAQIILPAAAVVDEGLESFVFRRVFHSDHNAAVSGDNQVQKASHVTQAHDGHDHDGHTHHGHTHDDHAHDDHAHDGHSHDGHAHNGHTHDDHAHDDHAHDDPGPADHHVHDDGDTGAHDHGHAHDDRPQQRRDGTTADAHEDDHLDFERVPVVVLYRSGAEVVVKSDGVLREGDVVALNRAYELNLALKQQADQGGSGHHHDHGH